MRNSNNSKGTHKVVMDGLSRAVRVFPASPLRAPMRRGLWRSMGAIDFKIMGRSRGLRQV